MKTGPSADAGDVADEHLAEAGGERRRVVAHLIGVREDDVVRLLGFDELLESGGEAVGGVVREQRMLDAHNFGERLSCEASAARASVCCAEARRR